MILIERQVQVNLNSKLITIEVLIDSPIVMLVL